MLKCPSLLGFLVGGGLQGEGIGKRLELSPGGPDHCLTIPFPLFFARELNGNNITRIHKNDFAGLKQLRVL